MLTHSKISTNNKRKICIAIKCQPSLLTSACLMQSTTSLCSSTYECWDTSGDQRQCPLQRTRPLCPTWLVNPCKNTQRLTYCLLLSSDPFITGCLSHSPDSRQNGVFVSWCCSILVWTRLRDYRTPKTLDRTRYLFLITIFLILRQQNYAAEKPVGLTRQWKVLF